MKKKIVLELDDTNNMVYDANSMYVGCLIGIKPFDATDEQRGVPIDDLVKLRNAGFTTDEIIELKRKELLK
jgi:hypothetical protein